MKQRPKSDHSINSLITIGAIAATIGGWGIFSRNLPQSTQSVAQTTQSSGFVAPIDSAASEQASSFQQPPQATRIPRAVTRTRSSR